VVMGSNYIDPVSYIQQHLGSGETSDIHIGHNHLKVGDIKQAKTFYHDIL
jgi:catechol-2,3-dioxygenase